MGISSSRSTWKSWRIQSVKLFARQAPDCLPDRDTEVSDIRSGRLRHHLVSCCSLRGTEVGAFVPVFLPPEQAASPAGLPGRGCEAPRPVMEGGVSARLPELTL